MKAKHTLLQMKRTQIVGWVLLVALALLAAPAQTAHAATITVPCDVTALINAINTANATPGANVLELAAGCTYTLTVVNNVGSVGDNGLPQITGNMTINAHGATIQRDNASAPELRFFQVNSGATLGLDDLTLRFGRVVASPKIDGGALFNNGGTITATNVVFADNSAGCGGAVYNSTGTFTATSTLFARNSADA